MQVGEYVIGKLGRGRLVAITNQWAIYRQRSGNEKVEPVSMVDPVRCPECRKLKAADDRPWYFTNGQLAKHKKCSGCKRTRFEEKGRGWKLWHLKECPECGKNPRNWDVVLRPSLRVGVKPPRPSYTVECRKCHQPRKKYGKKYGWRRCSNGYRY